MSVELRGGRVPVMLWVKNVIDVESAALDQLRRVACLPWVYHHVAAMPDVHFGRGCTVGSVVVMHGAVAPAAVGVDIGCGVAAAKLGLQANEVDAAQVRLLRSRVEELVPVGFNHHSETAPRRLRREDDLARSAVKLFNQFGGLAKKVQDQDGTAMRQLGTLGGGNHFIELCLDEAGEAWLMLHSGSRRIGKDLAEIHIGTARQLTHNAALPDRDLAVFLAGTPEMEAYRRDLYWAQDYALLNRRVMLRLCLRAVQEQWPHARLSDLVECHHNYVAEEVHFGEHVFVTRKGAIRAGRGELGVIPGSMGTRSYVIRGLGCPDSFESASHGAGRRMSRGAAKKTFTVQDLEAQTVGIECRKDAGVLDEIPGAYKDIDEVMANQADLVEIVATLRQVMCVKG